jgi:universal stress protein A
MTDIRTILVPSDFSSCAAAALRYAVSLATKLGATIHVVHVTPLPMLAVPDGGIMLPADILAQMSSEADRALGKLRKEWGEQGVTLHTHVAEGAPQHEIARVAQELKADLVVIGTHGRSGLAHMFMGSVAERVVRLSPVPVLTVREATQAGA